MKDLLLCFLLLYFVGNALSATYVVDPLDSQLPLIARVGQPYSWTFSERTFNSSDGALNYTSSTLPTWLNFDPGNRTFHGTPSSEDEGYPRVVVTARSPNPNSYASSGVNLCVTHYTLPNLRIPLADQFSGAPSSAMSSVFALQPRTALVSANPAVRIPRGWSFSIGFQKRTITSPHSDIYYDARSANGSDLPDWMTFNSNAVTLDGVVPESLGSMGPETVPLMLVGSDQDAGYTALALPFDIVVANHELSASTEELPTINITAGSPFTVNLFSPADFTGILIDGKFIQPPNISALAIDTSAYPWLRYDPLTRMLSGTPSANASDGNGKPSLPVTLTSVFNQTIHTTVSLQLVPSYFVFPELPALHLSPGDDFTVQLDQFYSNSTAGHRGDADVSVSYDPVQAANFIRFDDSGDLVSGTIAGDFAGDHITVSFTAYSRITHSTSHANLIIFMSPSPAGRSGQIPHPTPTGLSVQAKRKLSLGLGITFGAIGGLLAMIGFFALCRHFAHVPDSALTGEEGRMGWTEKDRRYYGFGTDRSLENQYRRSEEESSETSEEPMPPPRNAGEYAPMDLAQHRTHERSHSYTGSDFMSSAMMSKREFMTRIKQTVRHVSNKYGGPASRGKALPARPLIGKPILLRPSGFVDIHSPVLPLQGSVENPFDDRYSQRGSTFMTGSPSTSTAEHSIPRRRADFGPPRSMAQVHFEDGKLVRQGSNGSMRSNRLGVISRTTSVRSGRSTRTTSLLSHEFVPGEIDPANARPRLVPFTSSTRVPVPRVSSLVPTGDDFAGAQANNLAKTRIASQRAKIYKEPNGDDIPFADTSRKSISADDLSMGLHYVQSLGNNDQTTAAERPSAASAGHEATRYVVRTGEKFHIRVQIPTTTRYLQIQQVSGLALPSFLQFDANGAKGIVEFTGTALSRDLGALNVGIYADKECILRVMIEVVPRR
ncbi:hypothetical protein D9611_012509 [Ephemerocybe angulata]|uniref:Dystroglycan-type cadherin-like domain-containing protein n=1 Tax=Ephemerocybe angulata TaxID=980116 RepID=A0A8H5CAW2_9AGAR|nr:hypothetical protein D9611_012509 [Tulosesus angulatus]